MASTRSNDDDWVLFAVIGGALAAIAAGAWAAWWLAARFSSAPAVPGGPFATVKALKDGDATWPTSATWWAAAMLTVAVAATVAVLLRGPRRHVDRGAKQLPTDPGIRRYTSGTGPTVGRLISGRSTGRRPTLRATIEDQIVVVAGPRTGKTTSIVTPGIIDHQGPVLATSNKRDILDTTQPVRADVGTVWTFDPQAIATNATPGWWWDPLSICGDVRGARKVAAIWASAKQKPGERGDAYFGPEGTELVAGLLLAAARGNQPVSAVYRWLMHPSDPEPAVLLAAEPGCELMHAGLESRQQLPDKQRAGVYATAAALVDWLADPGIREWIEDPGLRPAFDPTEFATSTDTLICLSREGEGSATALVTTMTAAVCQAAEEVATHAPGGRLETPMLAMLDEAANVCRWPELPNLVSHYGSRGIIVAAVFQSWGQMVEAFGEQGAEKLFSACNVRIYGGGVSDDRFLKRLSDLCGDYDHTSVSTSRSRMGGTSRQQSTQRRAVYDVATLGAMPPGRALVLLSAARPVLVELIPWYDGPHAKQINAAPVGADDAA